MNRKKMLICGATGFIGRNLLQRFRNDDRYRVYATYHERPAVSAGVGSVEWISADLRKPEDAISAVRGMDIVLQSAATTSGAKDIVAQPHTHITDNAVMNSYLFRACHDHRVGHLVFFSCSIMYPDSGGAPLSEENFRYEIADKYFGGGWNKVYLEKMCEFYARLGATRFTAIRHSNIYGPHDKFDLERSHVFGATVAKVLATPQNGTIVVWGDGSEKRDLLYVDDLVDFVDTVLVGQKTPFELVNVGTGVAISVRELVEKIAAASGKTLRIAFDASLPTIPFSLSLNSDRARDLYGWSPKMTLEDGIATTLDWVSRGHNT